MDTSLNQLLAKLGQQPANVDLAHAYGLKINNVVWEDVGRDKNSCIGPNISDMTLTVDDRRMPIIRKPNFSDITCDLKIADFKVTVGNETKSGELRRIPLIEYLEDLTTFNSSSTHDKQGSVLIDRDEHLLASAQACVLPLGHGTDQEGNEIKEVEFVPEIFNYQSNSSEPAVMVVVASSQGTSATILTSRAQKLYFNRGGESVQFLAKRLSLDRKERGVEDKGDMTAEEQDRNLILVFQIPLKQAPPASRSRYSEPLYQMSPVCLKPYVNRWKFQNSMYVPMSACRAAVRMKDSGPSKYTTGSEEDEEDEEDADMGFSLNESGISFGSGNIGINNCSPAYDLDVNGNLSSSKGVKRCSAKTLGSKPAKGMENAMLKVSDTSRGSYNGLHKELLERDERFPIRVTLQHYKVSDTQQLSEDAIKYIANKINTIYDNAASQGSLVVGGNSSSEKTKRPTEIQKVKVRDLPCHTDLSDKPLFAMPKPEEEWCSVSA